MKLGSSFIDKILMMSSSILSLTLWQVQQSPEKARTGERESITRLKQLQQLLHKLQLLKLRRMAKLIKK